MKAVYGKFNSVYISREVSADIQVELSIMQWRQGSELRRVWTMTFGPYQHRDGKWSHKDWE